MTAPPGKTSEPPREAVVVEDDEDIGRLLKFIVEREGFAVTLCTDGRAAGERIKGPVPPALVILDVMLPYASGFELLEAIRKTPSWAKVPVLMLTAKSRETDVVRGLEGGANDYMTKPFQPAELKARIRRLVGAT
jgi:two-component system alkaline phosphatase synthesis response regulator PhoP